MKYGGHQMGIQVKFYPHADSKKQGRILKALKAKSKLISAPKVDCRDDFPRVCLYCGKSIDWSLEGYRDGVVEHSRSCSVLGPLVERLNEQPEVGTVEFSETA